MIAPELALNWLDAKTLNKRCVAQDHHRILRMLKAGTIDFV